MTTVDSEFWETSAPQIVMELNIKIICEWHLSGHLTIIEGTDNRPKWHLGSWVSDQRCATDGFVNRSTHENLLHSTDFDISDSKNCSIQKKIETNLHRFSRTMNFAYRPRTFSQF